MSDVVTRLRAENHQLREGNGMVEAQLAEAVDALRPFADFHSHDEMCVISHPDWVIDASTDTDGNVYQYTGHDVRAACEVVARYGEGRGGARR